MQATEQEPSKSKHPGNPNWVKGISQNPAAIRRARVEATMAEWTEPVGGISALKPVECALVRRAVELYLYSKPKTIEDQARIANTIGRLVAQAGLANARHSKPTR
jgi:hypothetical protein